MKQQLMTIPQIAAKHRVAASTLYARARTVPVTGTRIGSQEAFTEAQVRKLLTPGTRGRRKKKTHRRGAEARRK